MGLGKALQSGRFFFTVMSAPRTPVIDPDSVTALLHHRTWSIILLANRGRHGMRLNAWIDETAGKGVVGLLDASRDADFAVFAALVVPDGWNDRLSGSLQPAFDRFRAAAPEGAKLHITDAFARGPQGPRYPIWQAAATVAREEVIAALREWSPCVVYAARRMRIARTQEASHRRNREDLKAHAEASSTLRFPQVRGSDERVDTQAFADLALLLLETANALGCNGVQPFLDHVDAPLLDAYRNAIRSMDRPRQEIHVASAFDTATKTPVRTERTFTYSASPEFRALFGLDTHIHNPLIRPVGSELFAIDVIANALAKHLRMLPATAALHGPAATADWPFADLLLTSNDAEAGALDIF